MRRLGILLVVAAAVAVQYAAMRDVALGVDAGPSLTDLKRQEAINDERVRQALRSR